jgi:hypothetical protein
MASGWFLGILRVFFFFFLFGFRRLALLFAWCTGMGRVYEYVCTSRGFFFLFWTGVVMALELEEEKDPDDGTRKAKVQD